VFVPGKAFQHSLMFVSEARTFLTVLNIKEELSIATATLSLLIPPTGLDVLRIFTAVIYEMLVINSSVCPSLTFPA